MVRLFISDIDGCLSEPYHPYDLALFAELAGCVAEGGGLGGGGPAPAFSLCSGRAYPYVEAVTQALGLRVPVLFESGGGLFDPVAARVEWNPRFDADVEAQVEAVRRWLRFERLPGTSMMYDYGKRTQAGIIGPDREEVATQVPLVEAYVAERFPDLCVFHTPVSIDVMARTITKAQALHWLSARTGVALGEMAYIGDTGGDLGALEAVGYSFAPANADASVRARVRHVTEGSVAAGVLEAFRQCVAMN